MPLMSQSEYAKHRGISQPRVHAYIKSGKLEGAVSKKRGKNSYSIDSEKADEILAGALNPGKESPSKIATPERTESNDDPPKINMRNIKAGDFALFKARNEAQKAMLLQIEIKEKKGELVDKAKVANEHFEFAREVRDNLLAVPERVAALVASETDIMKCQHIVDNEIRLAMTAVLEMFEGK